MTPFDILCVCSCIESHLDSYIRYSTAIGHASILEYPWRAVNIFTCILLYVHSLCTRTKNASFVRVPCENTSAVVNLAMSCTVRQTTCEIDTTSSCVYRIIHKSTDNTRRTNKNTHKFTTREFKV